MKMRIITQLLLLGAAVAGGFWLSRRLSQPTLSHVPVQTPPGGVRLVSTQDTA